MGKKIGELPIEKRQEFKQKYMKYQKDIMDKWQ